MDVSDELAVGVERAPMVKGPEGVPVHLLWDDVSPLQSTGQKKKTKKKGWGHSLAAEAGASPEERGVASITLAQLPGFQAPSSSASAPQSNPMAVDDDDGMDEDVKPRSGGPRRNRRILAPEDED